MNTATPNIDAPIISVLLPVYNGEPYIREAVDSVLAQSFEDFELLVLDDGSTDNSLAILKEYEAKDPRVRVITRENRGLVPTLNELVAEARGRYLARMDADDICLPDRFEKQVVFLNTATDHVVVGGWIEQMNAAGQPIGVIRTPTDHLDIDEAHLKGYCSIWHPSSMIRPDAMINVGGYDPDFDGAEDFDLWLRLAEIGKLANIPEVLLRFRLHGGSISERKRDHQRILARAACKKAWERRGITGRFEATDHWRPGADKASRHEFALKYGWVSWGHGHRETWWTYARQALWLRPFALSSWRLLVFGLVRSPKGKP